jgi:hypothetical protein
MLLDRINALKFAEEINRLDDPQEQAYILCPKNIARDLPCPQCGSYKQKLRKNNIVECARCHGLLGMWDQNRRKII